jgi:multicomponent Na+:H+ antiporter subunit E
MDQREAHSQNPPKERPSSTAGSGSSHTWRRTMALGILLAAFWFLLSGRWGVQYVLFMLATVITVLVLNPERPFGWRRPDGGGGLRGAGFRGRVRAIGYLFRYLVWLVWNVIKANVEVAKLILHPRLPIQPRLLTFRTTLDHPVAQVLVANSITLTPGTVTIDLTEQEYLVHSLVPASSGGVTGAALQNMVGPIFGEGADPVPEVKWYTSYRDVVG